LLNNFEQDVPASCPGGGDQIISGKEQSSAGFILLQNVTVCTAGQNELIYDIGTLNELGSFVPLVLGVYSANMVVVAGPAAVFRLILRNSAIQHTYSKIFAVGVLLQDQGRNVSSSLSTHFVLQFHSFVYFVSFDIFRMWKVQPSSLCPQSMPIPR
jgi:hypothetical protein